MLLACSRATGKPQAHAESLHSSARKSTCNRINHEDSGRVCQVYRAYSNVFEQMKQLDESPTLRSITLDPRVSAQFNK